MKKYIKLLPILIMVVTLLLLWKIPVATPILAIAIVIFSLATAILTVFKKNRKAYLQGKITHGVFARNILVEILGILLAMTLAGLLGRYLAQLAIAKITNELIKLIASIVIGSLAGMGVGFAMKRTWGQLLKL